MIELADLKVKQPETGYTRPATIEDLVEALKGEGAKVVETTEKWSGTTKYPITGLTRGTYLVVRIK